MKIIAVSRQDLPEAEGFDSDIITYMLGKGYSYTMTAMAFEKRVMKFSVNRCGYKTLLKIEDDLKSLTSDSSLVIDFD